MKPFPIPVHAVGPGSQPEDDALNYMPMPHDMQTYRPPVLPEPEQMQGRAGARRALAAVLAVLAGGQPGRVDLGDLEPAALELLGQVLGEGEVSARAESGDSLVLAQESVFAGVWRVREQAAGLTVADAVEVADVPAALRARLHAPVPAIARPEAGAGVANAPALLAEIEEQLGLGTAQHVINLTLLPFTPGDGDYLDQALGRNGVTILSRGYGNCRITGTGVPRVWWVQYFNAQDALILNTIEIADVPEVARAAADDLADSRERLAEVLDWIG
ncbi:hydrogenase expression/formation protein [Parasulfuritortus cantonensis]|uniref:Hydrogenase expression/formation protein n=1 Tax=Parasulfuritortus cantonensis TaxID=2528202 RepID=A0A4R1BIM3_9PROT|nr:hydrogenase expression/formation C-terminal domain-containing protein [Parasulfuritortus cantonensis]TCJ17175.1 hydrogenase expression/formation protein [Parasulfuritortus cantonensis]